MGTRSPRIESRPELDARVRGEAIVDRISGVRDDRRAVGTEGEVVVAEPLDLSLVTLRLRKPVYRYYQYQALTNDCGPTTLAIAANTLWGREELQGPTVAREMNRIGLAWRAFPYIGPSRIPGWATFPWGLVHHLRKRGLRARWHPFGSLDRLRRNLLDDTITVVIVGEPLRWENRGYRGWAHYKVLFGYEAGRGLLFVDPAVKRPKDPRRIEHHGLSWQGEAEFLRQWANLLRLYIEVG